MTLFQEKIPAVRESGFNRHMSWKTSLGKLVKNSCINQLNFKVKEYLPD
jgi:hypothetical protein